MDDSLGCDQLGRTELGRELGRAARRDDEVPSIPRDSLARRDLARRHAQDLDIGALAVLLRSQGIHRDDLLAERDLAALLLDLAGDLVGAPLQVVGKFSPGRVEGRQGDEGDESGRAERGEVGEEGVAGLGVAQSGEILEEAVRTTAKKARSAVLFLRSIHRLCMAKCASAPQSLCDTHGAKQRLPRTSCEIWSRKRRRPSQLTRFASCCQGASFRGAI